MDWKEINCIIDGLEALIFKYKSELGNADLSEDDRSDLSNDLAYTEILLGSYNNKRNEMASGE